MNDDFELIIPAKSLHDIREELVKSEADGTDQEAEVGREDKNPASGESVVRDAAGVAPEVLNAGQGVDAAQNRCNERVLETAQEKPHHEGRKKLERVLVSSLHTVERLGILVTLLLASVHGGVRHIVPPASPPNLRNHHES